MMLSDSLTNKLNKLNISTTSNPILRFKGISKKTKKWVYGSHAILNNKHFIVENSPQNLVIKILSFFIPKHQVVSAVEIIPETLCQSTGIMDSQNKSIYVNDIVATSGYFGIVAMIQGKPKIILCDHPKKNMVFEFFHSSMPNKRHTVDKNVMCIISSFDVI